MDRAQPATYRTFTVSRYFRSSNMWNFAYERDLKEKIKCNSSTDDFRNVRRDDSGFRKYVQSVIEPRGTMRLAHLGQVHARDGA
jgi:arylamine N-acetyltransferase